MTKISDEQQRKALKIWMRDNIKNHGMSAYEWATKAGTSPTNITRFLNGAKNIPSSRTIAKLARVSGNEPNSLYVTDTNTRTIEVFDTNGKRVRYVSVYGIEVKVLALQFDYDTGYFFGGIDREDVIILQENNMPNDKDVFCYEFENKFYIGQKIGKQVVHKSSEVRDIRDFKNVEVVGTVIQCIKNFKNASKIYNL